MRRIEAKPPNDWTPAEREAFEVLVLKGGEVDPDGLTGRILDARRLVFAYQDDTIIGVGALKDPNGHRDTVARNSKFPMTEADYPLELGWFYTEEAARKGGVATDMIATLLADVNEGVYATSHTANGGMHKVLKRNGFDTAGNAYPSALRENVEIQLFQRSKSLK